MNLQFGVGALALTLVLASVAGGQSPPARFGRAANGMALPDPDVTPGVTRPLTRQAVCATAWGLDRRHVTPAMKTAVCERYHVRCELGPGGYEIDHLVSRELGGADELANLWPQLWTEARIKDRVENRLHAAVCAGGISLEWAQRAIARDWTRLIPKETE